MNGWRDDTELTGFEMKLLPGAHGAGALVRRVPAGPLRRAVLYLHGFADYFFQVHLADWFASQRIAFYALDLPGHGRVLGETDYPSYYRDLAHFDPLIAAAIAEIDTAHQQPWLLVNGHSTGGLMAAGFAMRTPQRAPDALFLNSPFFDLNIDGFSRAALPLLLQLAHVAPQLPVGALGSVYGTSISASADGEWQYNLQWKPLAGFPMRAASLRAIVTAQRAVRAGAHLRQPVLVAHADRSAPPRTARAERDSADVVLDITHMRRDALRLGSDVTLTAIEGARHDLVLSRPAARNELFAVLARWLARVAPNDHHRP